MTPRSHPTPVWRGNHLALHDADGWEYVTRLRGRGVVGIIAVTEAGELILVEQHRPAVGGSVIELPAGLVGDEDSQESLEAAARRELLEETGFHADRFEPVCAGYASAGLTDEHITLLRARDVVRQTDGGGVGGERITIHLVPIHDVSAWLQGQRKRSAGVDLKVFLADALLVG